MRLRLFDPIIICVLFLGGAHPLWGQAFVTNAPSDPSAILPAESAQGGSPATLPEVIVTAPAFRLSPNSSLTASILTREQMAPYQPRTLGEALGPVAGVDVTSYGGAGSAELLSLRGSSSDQVLVLKDGQRLNSAQGGGVDLAALSLSRVERVEVIRGIAPSRYGVEGMGGIVNIVTSGTREGEYPSFRMTGASGSFGVYKAEGEYSFRPGDSPESSLTLSGGYAQSKGDYSFLDPVTGAGTSRQNTDSISKIAGVQLSFLAARNIRQRFSFNGSTQDSGAPGSIHFPTVNARIATQKNSFQYQAACSGFLAGDPHSKTSLNLQAFFQDLHYTNQGLNNTFEDDRHHNQSYEARWDNQASFLGGFLVHPSLGFRGDLLNSTTDGSRDNRTFYAALEGTGFVGRYPGVELDQDLAAEFAVTTGIRAEASSLFPAFLAPRLGVLWTLDRTQGLALKANAGALTRTPSFDDLFFPVTGLAAGNPGLRPENSTSWDIGFIHHPGPFSFGATGFLQEITDLIQWTPDFAGVWRPRNIAKASLRGLELEAHLTPLALAPFLQFGFDASHTFLEAIDRSGQPNVDGMRLVYRPGEKSSLGGTFILWGDLQLSYRSRFVGFRYTTQANTAFIPGFFTHQVGVKAQLFQGFDIAATVYNLADANYYDVNDYPMPGRQWEIKTSLAL
jgi:vitamin B12 transporter